LLELLINDYAERLLHDIQLRRAAQQNISSLIEKNLKHNEELRCSFDLFVCISR